MWASARGQQRSGHRDPVADCLRPLHEVPDRLREAVPPGYTDVDQFTLEAADKEARWLPAAGAGVKPRGVVPNPWGGSGGDGLLGRCELSRC